MSSYALSTKFAAGEIALDFPMTVNMRACTRSAFQFASLQRSMTHWLRDTKRHRKCNAWFMRNFSFFDAPAVGIFHAANRLWSA